VISVWIVASSAALRIGLRTLVQQDEALDVIGDSAFLAEFANSSTSADVLVLADVQPVPADLSLNRQAGQEMPALLLVTDQLQPYLSLLGLPWRAWGMLLPEADSGELRAAIHALDAGLLVGDPTLLKPLLDHPFSSLTRDDDDLIEPLTARELEVLQLLAQGMANKQISLALGISEHTVKFHVSSIYSRLGVTNRTEAVRVGFQRGLISL